MNEDLSFPNSMNFAVEGFWDQDSCHRGTVKGFSDSVRSVEEPGGENVSVCWDDDSCSRRVAVDCNLQTPCQESPRDRFLLTSWRFDPIAVDSNPSMPGGKNLLGAVFGVHSCVLSISTSLVSMLGI